MQTKEYPNQAIARLRRAKEICRNELIHYTTWLIDVDELDIQTMGYILSDILPIEEE